MTFDARSKERLEALGRTLPKKLPLPVPEAPAAPRVGGARTGGDEARSGGTRLSKPQAQRHALEQEQDPAKLFRALITASADGSVPPHLLDRLREIEGTRGPAAGGSAASQALASSTGTPSRKSTANPSTAASPAAAPRLGRKEGKGGAPASNRRGGRKSSRIVANEDQDLYTAFAQLLLEDDED